MRVQYDERLYVRKFIFGFALLASAFSAGAAEQKRLDELTGIIRKNTKSLSPYVLEIDGGHSIGLRGDVLTNLADRSQVWVRGVIHTYLYNNKQDANPAMMPVQWHLYMDVEACRKISKPFEQPESNSSQAGPVPNELCAKLQTLFQKYYRQASYTNREANGIHFESEVTKFEFPPADPTKKHENPIQRGPKVGGIFCNIYLQQGRYAGQLGLFPRGDGQYEPYVIDRKVFKLLLMAPYSAKRDSHLWVALSYPPDASEEFLKTFRALMKDFESNMY